MSHSRSQTPTWSDSSTGRKRTTRRARRTRLLSGWHMMGLSIGGYLVVAGGQLGCSLTERDLKDPERDVREIRLSPTDSTQLAPSEAANVEVPLSPAEEQTATDPPQEDNVPSVTEEPNLSLDPPQGSVEAEATCEDAETNGDESDVDCGGSCIRGCGSGASCSTSDDCEVELLCDTQRSVCTAPSCSDLQLTGTETDVDCGGDQCSPCGANAGCEVGNDCLSGVCVNATCQAATCADGLQNGDELQVDCASESCGLCALGSTCENAQQCASGQCEFSTCTPAPTCNDGVANGPETDVDCGGTNSECARCEDRAGCVEDSDCSSGNCDQGSCVSCNDGIANGGETGVDCGGPDPACGACNPGAGCSLDSDCASGACQDGACCGGSETDCTRCAVRLSISSCQSGECSSFLQCLADNSNVCSIRFSSGCALNVGDPCDHRLFGGEGGAAVQNANQVLVNAGCRLQ